MDATRQSARRPSVVYTRRVVVLGALAGLAVVVWGGYDRAWSWTGLRSRADLWDWLELVLPPLAVAVVPLWLLRRRALPRSAHLVLGTIAAAFVALVVTGYALDLEWTGFPGNELWDWLELLVLPLALAAWPFWVELWQGPSRRQKLLLVVAGLAFAVVVVLGYTLDWRWTGFRGNTLWDWLHLFLLPIVLATAIVPAALAALESASGGGSRTGDY
jgi:hypothetical protein